MRLAYWILACAAYAFFLFHKIDLTTADLGRHLKNGEWFLTHHKIPSTNFYSYTFPDFPAVNHHWGGGVLFFLVWKLAGFPGLTVLFAALSLAAFAFFFKVAEDEAGTGLAFVAALLVTPLLAERLEVRPEVLSYLFCGVFFWVLWAHRGRPEFSRWFWVLPALEVLWVNSHIYFFLGPLLVGIFWTGSLAEERGTAHSRSLLILLLATEAATFATPFGLHGALAPLEVFRNYGYRIVENQSMWTLIRVSYQHPNVYWFIFVFAALAAGFAFAIARGGKKIPPVAFVLALLFGAMGWLALRNLTIFGFFAIPLLALTFSRGLFPAGDGELSGGWVLLASALIAGLACVGLSASIMRATWSFGAGLLPGNLKAAKYFEYNHLAGPILNNYDIGGYLIYTLPEDERVFVDNRPEAYPASFFNDVYIPMLADNAVWLREDERRRFNVIYFDHQEHAVWTKAFMARRLQDPGWALVYYDPQVLILLRRTPQNEAVIQRDEIPSSRFVPPREWLEAEKIESRLAAAASIR